MFGKIILPAGLLAGTIIGAGVFGLPYLFEKSGVIVGLLYLTAFGIIFSLMHLMYAEIIINTKENHRFVGYTKIYLGKWEALLATLTSVVGILLSLTAYLILSISFFNLISPDSPDIYKLSLFWLLGSLAIFWEINHLVFAEFLITIGIVGIIIALAGYGLIGAEPLISFSFIAPRNLLIPYGAVLFSLSGRVAIPALVGYFRRNRLPFNGLKPAVFFGTLAPALIYFIFVVGILSLSETVSEDSISGIIGRLPKLLLWLLGVLGILALWSTYIVLGRDLKKSLNYDFNIPPLLAGLAAIITPLVLYFGGVRDFLTLIGIIGGVFIGLEGIFIVFMKQKISPLNRPLAYALIFVFAGGIVYELVKLLMRLMALYA